MTRATDCWGIARKFRREVEEATDPAVRAAAIAAAERWEHRAAEAEHHESLLLRPFG